MKKTLEQRINRLERLLKNEACGSKKFESFESDLDDVGAHATANRIAQGFGRLLGVSVRPGDSTGDVIHSPKYGWLQVTDVEEIESDPDARFVFQYIIDDGEFEFYVYPSDHSVNLINEDGYSVNPEGKLTTLFDEVSDAYPLHRWKGFDLSMVEDDYYDEAKCRTRRSMNSESARKCGRRMCRRTGR